MMDWQNFQTPCYLIDMETFRQNCLAIMEPFGQRWRGAVEFGYSVKTNHEKALMRYAAENLGWYIETVSPDEYRYALSMTDPNRIIFNGPCKGDLTDVCEKGGIVNLDHLAETEALCRLAKERSGILNNTEIGLRLNFNLEKHCPGETTAGDAVSRFGICYENGDFGRAIAMLRDAGIEPAGIHLHTSTKSRSTGVFAMLARKAAEAAEEYSLNLSYVDMGGGFFGGQKVAGKPGMKDYAESICHELERTVNPEKTRLILEPGASVTATCVSYLSRVINTREIRDTAVATLDGTLLHINPFMSSRIPPYEFRPQGTKERRRCEKQIICGCTCMENDRFLELEGATRIVTGDLFVFKYAGAYTMAFNSDFILSPPRVYVTDQSCSQLKQLRGI